MRTDWIHINHRRRDIFQITFLMGLYTEKCVCVYNHRELHSFFPPVLLDWIGKQCAWKL